MKAIAINGSPRKGGNTELMLQKALDVLSAGGISCEMLQVGGKNIKPCMGCGACREEGNASCAIKGDIFDEIYPKMVEADIIILGSPVYFGSATPELMALLDRAGYVARLRGIFDRKLGGPISVARRAGQNFTYAQLMYWYMINGMIVPGSTYWNIGFGGAKGDVEDDTEAIDTVEGFAKNLLWLSEKISDK